MVQKCSTSPKWYIRKDATNNRNLIRRYNNDDLVVRVQFSGWEVYDDGHERKTKKRQKTKGIKPPFATGSYPKAGHTTEGCYIRYSGR